MRCLDFSERGVETMNQFSDSGIRGNRRGFSVLRILLLFCLATAVGCSPQTVAVITTVEVIKTVEVEKVVVQTMPPAEEAPATAKPAEKIASPTLSPEEMHTRYMLRARYNHADHSLAVEQRILYTNTTGESLANFVLMVEPNWHPGVFQLTRLVWIPYMDETESALPSPMPWGDVMEIMDGYFLEGNRLTAPLPQLLPPGGQAALEIGFTLLLPPIPEDSEEYKPVPFGYTERQVNLVDWYPFLPPYRQDEGWLAHAPWYYGEHQVYDVADYAVEFETSGSVEPLVLAASAPPESQRGNLTRYRLEQVRNFVVSISPYYQVYTRQVDGVTISSYGLPYFESGAQAALQYTAEALVVYNQLFGPYPHRNLSVVVADFLDGMEYDGLYFLSRGFYNTYDGTPANYLAMIAVHETAHQWWYAQVGNDQALEPWLDEALCTYSERLFYERMYPDLSAWWWAYRVDFYEPAGLAGGAVYEYTGFRPYRDAVYLRGAQFLEALRRQVGDDTFLQFLKDYAGRMAGKQATAEDFFAILAEHSTENISRLRQEYFGK